MNQDTGNKNVAKSTNLKLCPKKDFWKNNYLSFCIFIDPLRTELQYINETQNFANKYTDFIPIVSIFEI